MMFWRRFDWFLLIPIVPIMVLGLLTMKSLGGDDYFFNRQLLWIGVGILAMFGAAAIDWRGLKSSSFILAMYGIGVLVLIGLAIFGFATRGAQSWLYVGSAGIEPVELIKFSLILLLAKYFSGRYVEIALWRHLAISFFYVAIPLTLVFLQPDFGSAMLLFFIWGAMVLFAGLNARQIIVLAVIGGVIASVGWFALLQPYQKERILAFLNPERDPHRSGYHAIQAMIAVGSGGVGGKGVG